MCGAIPPLPHYALMAWCSVKAQGQLYLLPAYVHDIQLNIFTISSEWFTFWLLFINKEGVYKSDSKCHWSVIFTTTDV
jgi:hypothetical protein